MFKLFTKVNKKRVEEKAVEETNTEKYLKQIAEILEKNKFQCLTEVLIPDCMVLVLFIFLG